MIIPRDFFLDSLRSRPFYILLLPLFFVLHGVRENFGFIMLSDAASLWLFYSAVILLLYLVLFFLYRKKQQKAGLLTFLFSCIFFFFGAVQDFLKSNIPQLNRYIILFPAIIVVIISAIIILKKTKSLLKKISLYLNLLLLLLSVYDISAVIFNTLFPEKDKFTIYPFAQNKDYEICADCNKPDIFFLLFDEYASSVSLNDYLGYNNSEMDSFFTNKQFRIQKYSSGNYNYTPFSMASILNMAYINGMYSKKIGIDDFARCTKLVRENKVIKFLSSYGYEIVNYSIFDLAGNPSPFYQNFLPLKTKLITDRTLWGKIRTDILWNLLTGRFEVKWLTTNVIYTSLHNNDKLFDLLKKESLKKSMTPRFIYAHFNLPHHPFYFDKNGKLKDKETLINDYSKNSYLDNVRYANKKIRELVDTIQTNSNGKAVIIVMGDHGYRSDATVPEKVFFENLNAVYLPAQNYHLFYDSVTGVNQFRVVLNSLFKQNLPLLKDSTTFLRIK
ncbi:MAG: hypothetical protein JWM28_3015 [Chitinophagaceae bacterium]|nr:hypothetical protein [Chitinophagaceae bacterium]